MTGSIAMVSMEYVGSFQYVHLFPSPLDKEYMFQSQYGFPITKQKDFFLKQPGVNILALRRAIEGWYSTPKTKTNVSIEELIGAYLINSLTRKCMLRGTT